jgi:hypothetical protein
VQEEKYATRDQAYSAWHRWGAIKRYGLTEAAAKSLALIDIDGTMYVEAEDKTYIPLALIETALDVGQAYKTATCTKNLAIQAGIPAYVVLYKTSEEPNPADPRYPDITSFRVRRLNPSAETDFRVCTPEQWAFALCGIRDWQMKRIKRVDGPGLYTAVELAHAVSLIQKLKAGQIKIVETGLQYGGKA